MKIKDNKCKCGHDDFFFADKGNQKGIYCSYCGKWLKWADKDEQNLRMKQVKESAISLDRIKEAREEIDDLDRYFDNDYFSSNSDAMFKCSDVLVILDQLISEGEEK